MTLQQLNYFCLVAELQSINKVAQQVHVSEPALSKSIHLLEQELNVRLFNRSGRKLKLNENGDFFYRNVSACLERLEETVDALTSSTSLKEIRINVEAGDLFIEDIVTEYYSLHNDVAFSMSANNQPVVRFSSDSYDLIVTTSNSLLIRAANFKHQEIFTEPYGVCIPRADPLAQYPSIRIAQLRDRRFVSTTSYGINYQICKKAGFLPKQMMIGQSLSSFVKMLEIGSGIAIVPILSFGAYLPSNCVCVPLAPEDAHNRTIVLVETRFRPTTDYIQDFITFCVQRGREKVETLPQILHPNGSPAPSSDPSPHP